MNIMIRFSTGLEWDHLSPKAVIEQKFSDLDDLYNEFLYT